VPAPTGQILVHPGSFDSTFSWESIGLFPNSNNTFTLQDDDALLEGKLPEHGTFLTTSVHEPRTPNQPANILSDSDEEGLLAPLDLSADIGDPKAASCLLPLTKDNLSRVNRLHKGFPAPSTQPLSDPGESSDPDMNASTKSVGVDNPNTLRAHSIVQVNEREPLPDALQAHLKNVLLKPRPYSSPNAKKIVAKRYPLRTLNEATSSAVLIPLLLFSDDEGEPAIISRVQQCKLLRTYLPPLYNDRPNNKIQVSSSQDIGVLKQPVVDHCVGYCPNARLGYDVDKKYAPFTREEEEEFEPEAATSLVHFPFITAESKNDHAGGTISAGEYQAQRGAAAIQRHLEHCYEEAGMSPSVVDTYHISVVHNVDHAYLNIHWVSKEGDRTWYRMVNYETFRLKKEADIIEFRKFMRNHLEWYLDQRLKRLRAVVKSMVNRRNAVASKGSKATSSSPGSAVEVDMPSLPSNFVTGKLVPPSVRRSARNGGHGHPFQDVEEQ
jgi:hypothetical protein